MVVVGDAKQSIYRFRRAEVRLFRDIAEKARENPGWDVLHLKQNFRSRPAILRFVNRVFADLIEASDEADQTDYEAIDPPPGLPEEPSVVALRFGRHAGEKYGEREEKTNEWNRPIKKYGLHNPTPSSVRKPGKQ